MVKKKTNKTPEIYSLSILQSQAVYNCLVIIVVFCTSDTKSTMSNCPSSLELTQLTHVFPRIFYHLENMHIVMALYAIADLCDVETSCVHFDIIVYSVYPCRVI